MTIELHRPVGIARVGPHGLDVTVEASPAECTALAQRLQLPDVQTLTCTFHLERDTADALLAHGHLRARVVQSCVVTMEDFSADVEERFTVRCVPAGQESDDPDPAALDEIAYTDGVLDLGEAAAEQLALALEPYPRAPDAELPELGDDTDSRPFAALGALRRPH